MSRRLAVVIVALSACTRPPSPSPEPTPAPVAAPAPASSEPSDAAPPAPNPTADLPDPSIRCRPECGPTGMDGRCGYYQGRRSHRPAPGGRSAPPRLMSCPAICCDPVRRRPHLVPVPLTARDLAQVRATRSLYTMSSWFGGRRLSVHCPSTWSASSGGRETAECPVAPVVIGGMQADLSLRAQRPSGQPCNREQVCDADIELRPRPGASPGWTARMIAGLRGEQGIRELSGSPDLVRFALDGVEIHADGKAAVIRFK